MQPCDILSQCGCAGNEACDYDANDGMGTACRPVSAMGHETSTCSTGFECDKGYICLGVDGGSVCHRYCASNADCGSPRGECILDVTLDGTNPIPGVPPTCSANCDPTNIAAGGCPAGFKCGMYSGVPHAGMTYNMLDCEIAPGNGTQGANCQSGSSGDDQLCAANYRCTVVSNNYRCRRICDKANPHCGSGQVCSSFIPPFTIGAVEYGFCQ
jgi:hypothetical protein